MPKFTFTQKQVAKLPERTRRAQLYADVESLLQDALQATPAGEYDHEHLCAQIGEDLVFANRLQAIVGEVTSGVVEVAAALGDDAFIDAVGRVPVTKCEENVLAAVEAHLGVVADTGAAQ